MNNSKIFFIYISLFYLNDMDIGKNYIYLHSMESGIKQDPCKISHKRLTIVGILILTNYRNEHSNCKEDCQ